MESRAWLGIQKLNALRVVLPPVRLTDAASPAMTAGRKAFSPQFFAASAPQLKGGVFQNLIYPRHSHAKEIDMTQEQQPAALLLASALDRSTAEHDLFRKSTVALRRLYKRVQELEAQRKPLTDEQAKKIGEEALRAVLDELEDNLTVAVVRRTERAHGIGEAA